MVVMGNRPYRIPLDRDHTPMAISLALERR